MNICLNNTLILFTMSLDIFLYVLNFMKHIWNNLMRLWALSILYYFLYWGAMRKMSTESVTKFLLQIIVKKTHLLFTWKRRELSAWLWMISINVDLFSVFYFYSWWRKKIFKCSWFIASFFYLSSSLSAFSNTSL